MRDLSSLTRNSEPGPPLLQARSLNHWTPGKFLSKFFFFFGNFRSVFCYIEAILGGLLDGFKMGAGLQKDQARIRSLDRSASAPNLWEGGREAGDSLNGESYLQDEAYIKIPKVR